eukprot:s582_g9.t1
MSSLFLFKQQCFTLHFGSRREPLCTEEVAISSFLHYDPCSLIRPLAWTHEQKNSHSALRDCLDLAVTRGCATVEHAVACLIRSSEGQRKDRD